VVVVEKPWAWQNGGGRGPNAVGMGSAIVRTGLLTGEPQPFRIFFSIYAKLAQL
jgi:hypothetical protein